MRGVYDDEVDEDVEATTRRMVVALRIACAAAVAAVGQVEKEAAYSVTNWPQRRQRRLHA